MSEESLIAKAEKLVHDVMGKWDGSHDALHALRVRNLALSLAKQENLPPHTLQTVELAALLHDIGDHKYSGDGADSNAAHDFLTTNGVEPLKRDRILSIISRMGFKDEIDKASYHELMPEFGVVQDADRLDAIGAIGIARCFAYGGSRKHVLYDPELKVRTTLTKEEYTEQHGKHSSIHHFYEKLLKLKDLMKTQAGKERAEQRHMFMQCFLKEFYQEWEGKS